MKKKHAANAIKTLDQHFMRLWRTYTPDVKNAFNRTGGECRKLMRSNRIVTLIGAALTTIMSILFCGTIQSSYFGLGWKIGSVGFLATGIGMLAFALSKRPGKMIIRAGQDWDRALDQARKFGLVREITAWIAKSESGQPLGEGELRKCVEKNLQTIANGMHRYEADGDEYRKKAIKKRFYDVYNFAEGKLGVKLEPTGVYLGTEIIRIRIGL